MRSDVFAFGAIAYEMVTGARAFEAASQASLIAAILKDTPPSMATKTVAPAALDRVVRTCLAKDPDDRWQSAGDLKRELQWIAASPVEPTTAGPLAAPLSSIGTRLGWGAIGLTVGTEGASNPFFSPDGQWVGFLADDLERRRNRSDLEPQTGGNC